MLVGLLIGDEVNGSLAGRVPQHGVPGGPGQRDVVDGVEPRLRPEGVPVALHHVRQGQDVGVEVAVVELAEGLPPHEIGGVDGQPGSPLFLPARCRSSATPTPSKGMAATVWGRVGRRSCTSG